MKAFLRSLPLTFLGLLIMAGVILLPVLSSIAIPNLIGKFLLLIGCMLFGYGIASPIVARHTPTDFYYDEFEEEDEESVEKKVDITISAEDEIIETKKDFR